MDDVISWDQLFDFLDFNLWSVCPNIRQLVLILRTDRTQCFHIQRSKNYVIQTFPNSDSSVFLFSPITLKNDDSATPFHLFYTNDLKCILF